MRKTQVIHCAVAAAVTTLLAGCQPKPTEPVIVEVQGECGDLFGGQICSWAQMQGERVVAMGATVALSSIENAPADYEMTWPPTLGLQLKMPEHARASTGMSHFAIYWEPHGHPPGAFLTPHFDYHFYGISPEERVAIDCADSTKPEVLPAGYGMYDEDIPELGLLVGLCVPEMGMHALDSEAYVATELFDATMVVGYYGGKPIFVEPMVSRDFMMKKAGFTLPLPDASDGAGARYPTTFQADYDAEAQAYRLVFGGYGEPAPQ